ncbi:MAG: replication restart helicase PriA [Ruminococcus sp.]|jgi:primosomal protein N' (replication factor Y)
MEHVYADVIVDIASGELDRVFQYRVPEKMADRIKTGTLVTVPFGRGDRKVKAYVVGLTGEAQLEESKIKDILSVPEEPVSVESKLIALAAWMKETYGSTMLQALKTVLPMKEKVREKKTRKIVLEISQDKAEELLKEWEKKHRTARVRLLKELMEREELDYGEALKNLNLTASVVHAVEAMGVLSVKEEQIYRTPPAVSFEASSDFELSECQRRTADGILREYEGERKPCLIYGITGSGKTRIYMELIDQMLKKGRQAIVLIPEIALTYQVVYRFRRRFKDRAAVIHSRMSQGERWDAFEGARRGRVSVMIGPRSALFTPFPNLGLIVMDEEHESSYKSESAPRYHAREAAAARCRLEKALFVMGSATPSMESYYACRQGKNRLFTLTERFGNGSLPKVYTVDMREELKAGNTSVFSRRLEEALRDRLRRKEQAVLFLNRRGYAGFISCRNCGYVVKCPHCDVSLSLHGGHTLMCHYCGYTTQMINTCPECGSRYIGGFRAGTEQIEKLVGKIFPEARILRMDLDTTRKKEGYSRILSSFASGEADILIGTQMIIKGHDFPGVTLAGVLAADMSLYAGDYRAAEKTFQLLVQAVGRAGRGERPGEAVIQTYHPEHYSIQAACRQDYPAFFEEEMNYRTLMGYPPSSAMLAVMGSGRNKEQLSVAMEYIVKYIRRVGKDKRLAVIGPADEAISRIQDRYRKVLYLKHPSREYLSSVQKQIQRYMEVNSGFRKLSIQFDYQI